MPQPESKTQVSDGKRNLLTGLVLLLATLLLYQRAITTSFCLLDDGQYVLDNIHVNTGLSWQNIRWAFSSNYAANWHPLTWISHMLDWSLYADAAAGHHFTSVLIHSLNTVLVLIALNQLTGKFWRSAMVAALFGWHPLHVESVAWIAERKDVSSTFFFLLTLLAYSKYVQSEANKSRARRTSAYLLCLLFFGCGLMCKPMLVTLPFVLLLLDFWPLRRMVSSLEKPSRAPWLKLWLEKIPFFFFSACACVVTILAQSNGKAIRSQAEIPLLDRFLNASSGYGHYLAKAFLPRDLCIYYLLPVKVEWAPALLSLAVLLLVTILAIRWRLKFPWMLVGWFWFLGTLAPVIGLVQVGSQSMADRYMYIPLLGLAIPLVWGMAELFSRLANGSRIAAATGILMLSACAALTAHQLTFWSDNIALFGQAANVAPGNYFAEYELGMAHAGANHLGDAVFHHRAALRMDSSYLPAQIALANELAALGDLVGAEKEFVELLKSVPDNAESQNNLGAVLAQQGRLPEAESHFREAIRLDPRFAKAHFNLGNILQQQGNETQALSSYYLAVESSPNYVEALDKLASLLVLPKHTALSNPRKALEFSLRANGLVQNEVPEYLATLATCQAATADLPAAIATLETALKLPAANETSKVVELLKQQLAEYKGKLTAR